MPVPIFFQIRNRFDNAFTFTRCYRNYRPSQGHLHIVTTCLEFCKIRVSPDDWNKIHAFYVKCALGWPSVFVNNWSRVTNILHKKRQLYNTDKFSLVRSVAPNFSRDVCVLLFDCATRTSVFNICNTALILYGDSILAECSSDWTCYNISVTVPEAQTPPCFTYTSRHILFHVSYAYLPHLCFLHSTVHHISLAGSNYRLKPVIISLNRPLPHHARPLTL